MSPFSLARSVRTSSARYILTLALAVFFALVVAGMAQAFATGSGSSQADGPDFAAIDHYVQNEMKEMRMPGVALGIVKGDEIVHLEGFGEADSSGRKVTPHTPFIIGSTSKSFTALAIMELVEAGKVELDAPVRRYIPWFQVADQEASERITVRNLLNHTSGLSRAAGGEYLQKQDDSKGALERAVRSLRDVELDRPVGKSFEYSNVNYTILGLIVQRVSGESYEHYVNEHILTPLKMNNTYMFVPEAKRHGLATGHQYWFGWPFPGGGIVANRAATPSGYISSSAQDMSHFLIAQLNEGRYEGAQVLSAEGIAQMHRGTANMHGGSSYAMGWEDSELSGVPVVRHSGDTGNFHATMILVPESQWGVVVLMNGSNHLRLDGMDGIANSVTARLLGVEPPPEPFNQAKALLLVVLAIGALQALGIVRSVVLLRRWRTWLERRPHGMLRIGLRVVVPIVPNLLWAGICLVLLPWFSQTPLSLMVFSDSGLVQVLSGAVALVWGVVLRPVLVLLALRTKGAAPGDAGTPEEAGASGRA
jgi:CubicO group peptidase (beta-lactamase class C family)